MAVYFKRPEGKPNWGKALHSLLPAAGPGAAFAAAASAAVAPAALAALAALAASAIGFAASAHKAIRDAVEAARQDNTVDEHAWV